MKLIWLYFGVFQITATFTIAANANPTESNPDLDWASLLSGEVILSSLDNKEKIPGLIAYFTVSSSRQEIWNVLTDYENFHRIFKGTKIVRVIGRSKAGATVQIEYETNILNLFKLSFNYTLTRSYVKKGELIKWKRKAGDFRVIEGSWRILNTNQDKKFLLIYESYLDGDWLFPAQLARDASLKEAHRMCKHLRSWIENPQHK